ncbi:hypothetical protein BH23ACT11_BH23ACT11_15320 [soil metagenome]
MSGALPFPERRVVVRRARLAVAAERRRVLPHALGLLVPLQCDAPVLRYARESWSVQELCCAQESLNGQGRCEQLHRESGHRRWVADVPSLSGQPSDRQPCGRQLLLSADGTCRSCATHAHHHGSRFGSRVRHLGDPSRSATYEPREGYQKSTAWCLHDPADHRRDFCLLCRGNSHGSGAGGWHIHIHILHSRSRNRIRSGAGGSTSGRGCQYGSSERILIHSRDFRNTGRKTDHTSSYSRGQCTRSAHIQKCLCRDCSAAPPRSHTESKHRPAHSSGDSDGRIGMDRMDDDTDTKRDSIRSAEVNDTDSSQHNNRNSHRSRRTRHRIPDHHRSAPGRRSGTGYWDRRSSTDSLLRHLRGIQFLPVAPAHTVSTRHRPHNHRNHNRHRHRPRTGLIPGGRSHRYFPCRRRRVPLMATTCLSSSSRQAGELRNRRRSPSPA